MFAAAQGTETMCTEHTENRNRYGTAGTGMVAVFRLVFEHLCPMSVSLLAAICAEGESFESNLYGARQLYACSFVIYMDENG